MTKETLDAVLGLTSYAPSRTTNQIFEKLVHEVIQPGAFLPNDTAMQQAIRTIASESEYELELYWAQKISRSYFSALTLRSFPYLGNYKKLVRREHALLVGTGTRLAKDSTVLVIGSGPLPLTSYFIEKLYGACVDNVDVSPKAARLGGVLLRSLGASQTYLVGDGAGVKLSRQYDMILVAGLAGANQAEKQAIVDHACTQLAPGGKLMMRSAQGTRTLLYPEIIPEDLRRVNLVAAHHPSDDIINSILIFERSYV